MGTAFEWRDWETAELAEGVSPYIAWLDMIKVDRLLDDDPFSTRAELPPPVARDVVALAPQVVPLPQFARPPHEVPSQGLGDMPGITPPPRGSVIVGIIDTAIALAHQRFRRAEGETRFLAAWQQGARWQGPTRPFGAELHQAHIDQLLREANGDETAFNRAAGLVQWDEPAGDRGLERAQSHGTHVLDLATGREPDCAATGAEAEAGRQPIIAVTLPPRPSIGASGSYLQFFVIHAVEYILSVADALWEKGHGGTGLDGARGYPVVINLSYGLQAGPKDGNMQIERYLRDLIAWRRAHGRAPLRMILPAGNDNLEQGHILHTQRQDAPYIWRVKPEDRTASYLEIWSALRPGPGDSAAHSHALTITLPDGTRTELGRGHADEANTLYGDDAVASVFCRRAESTAPDGTAQHRMVYTLCLRPTFSYDAPVAPSGAWGIALSDESQPAYLYVQSDQNLTPYGGSGLGCYFDHPDYDRWDSQGRLRDSFSYSLDGGDPVPMDSAPLRRLQTLNAIASLDDCVVVSGHRVSDGRPAVYASSAGGQGGDTGRARPSVSLPSETSAALFGLRAAGSKSGSSGAMSGTSFATGLATRRAVGELLAWDRDGRDPRSRLGSAEWFEAHAPAEDAAQGYCGATAPAKSGGGRMRAPFSDRVAR